MNWGEFKKQNKTKQNTQMQTNKQTKAAYDENIVLLLSDN